MSLHGSHALALTALAGTQLMVILDGTIVTVALPAIRSGLGFSDASLAWVVNAFFLAFALVLLPAGRLGDLVGNREVFLAGLTLFTAASAACAIAWDPVSLVVARALQGLGGGLTSAVVLAMVAALHDDPGRRMRAFAVLAFVGSAGASVGLVAGGLLTELASWPWVFGVNVPIGIAIAVLALRVLPRRAPTGARGGLLPRALFADRRFGLAAGVLFAMVLAGMSFQYLSSLYLQDTLGHGPLATGLAFLAVSGAIAVASLGLSGRLAASYGAGRVLVAGLVLFLAGMLLMVRLPDDGSYLLDVAPAFVTMGVGFGLAMPQAMEVAMGAAPARHAGVASGFANTAQQAGGAFGLFVVPAAAAEGGRGVGFALAALALVVATGLAAALVRRPGVVGAAPTTPDGVLVECAGR